ncbi:MAG: N-acetylmuramoyl-L-alanine amidase family protein [Terracidiphilus sp.]
MLKGLLALLAAAGSLATAQPAPPAPAARFVVVIDAAHGGDDPGGRLNATDEKTLTLALSVRLRSLLAARGIQVVTTRESDATIDPDRRAELANHANAQACLSLHATESGTGAHLFISSLVPTQPTRIAAWKTAQSAWVTRSLALAGTLNSALLHTGLTVSLTRAALPVVDSMTCPAVAVEIAPESAQARDSTPQTPGSLDDPNYQARIAEALAAALLEWRTDALRTEARP